MSARPTFAGRLLAVVVPTGTQALGSIFIAMLVLILAQSQSLLQRLGITRTALLATQDQFNLRFDVILRSPIASQLALITFWATVGLAAYLICWGIYSVLVEARNEITLTATYTNRTDHAPSKHWRSALATLGLKTAAATALVLMIGSLWYGVSFWMTLAAQAVAHPALLSISLAILAVMGFALQLYLVLVCLQLTFSPWYRVETFTEF
jgi:hypothetical protein